MWPNQPKDEVIYAKVYLLRQEAVAARDHGPRKYLAGTLSEFGAKVAMWDATGLARELSPEISLHFSRELSRTMPPIHVLHYAVVRPDNQVVEATEQALDAWLSLNAGVQRKMQLGTALQVIRSSIATLSQESAKRANRHLTLFSKELDLSG